MFSTILSIEFWLLILYNNVIQEVLQNVFQLFEPNENEKIPSSVLIEFLNDQLKYKMSYTGADNKWRAELIIYLIKFRSNGWELKSVLESAIYILAEEDELNYSVFSRIFTARIVNKIKPFELYKKLVLNSFFFYI